MIGRRAACEQLSTNLFQHLFLVSRKNFSKISKFLKKKTLKVPIESTSSGLFLFINSDNRTFFQDRDSIKNICKFSDL
jgi:hypothetical protein